VVLLSHTYRSLLVLFDSPVGGRQVFCLLVLRTCDILVGIRIRGSVPLNYGSGFGSGSVLYVPYHFDTSFRGRKVFFLLVLRIRNILVRIQIHGSVPLTPGLGSGGCAEMADVCAGEGGDTYGRGAGRQEGHPKATL
jgi:hypothetical protein